MSVLYVQETTPLLVEFSVARPTTTLSAEVFGDRAPRPREAPQAPITEAPRPNSMIGAIVHRRRAGPTWNSATIMSAALGEVAPPAGIRYVSSQKLTSARPLETEPFLRAR